MLVVSSFEITESGKRTQPWGKTEDAVRDGMYYDFIKNPELIETNLEDFLPYSERNAVQVFYSLLRWINSDNSILESTDCLLSGEAEPTHEAGLFGLTHGITGRFEFFARKYEVNTLKEAIIWMFDKLSLYLQVERPNFRKGSFRITPLMTDYLISGGNQIAGHRFCVNFQAYGNGIEDAWLSLETMFDSLFKATRRLNDEMISGKGELLYKDV